MSKHIIKYDYRDGVKLAKHEIDTWCGHGTQASDWLFQDAQHALLSIEQGSLQVPCKKCLEAIVKVAQQECKHEFVYGWHSYGSKSGYQCRFCGKFQELK
ncbi:hypothetical protein [Citrobacter sp. Cf101]|uniref:hypothetical protein n=1 Tax=Citrobacter TaxID=544 RepID=UPI000ACD148E|nr:hypothetical protein [Citrobacter sp. Cf101]MDM3189123.1 hypothetical protein [Citrobacter sp. Cf101]